MDWVFSSQELLQAGELSASACQFADLTLHVGIAVQRILARSISLSSSNHPPLALKQLWLAVPQMGGTIIVGSAAEAYSIGRLLKLIRPSQAWPLESPIGVIPLI